MKIIAATNNNGKIKEIKAILGELGFEVVSQKEAGINIEVEETGKTFKENALLKAMAAYKISHTPAIADDSGLCVDFLNGAPGVYSARYAGENADTTENEEARKIVQHADRIKKLLHEMDGVEESKRTAHFTTAAVLVINEDEYYCSEGSVYGKILTSPAGNGGFGYDPVFYCDELKKTFAEALPEEKNKVSHRFRAISKLKEILKTNL